jgi:hypothetical protein
MAIDSYSTQHTTAYIGLSTDTKPTTSAFSGNTFFETDTGNEYVYNGASQTWSLMDDESGTDFAAVTLTAQATGTVNSADIQIGTAQGNSAGFNVSVNITAITAGSLTVTVQGKDAASGTYYTLLASAALAATGLTRLQVGPLIAASANLIAQTYIPRTIRISCAVVTGPVTATIGVSPV